MIGDVLLKSDYLVAGKLKCGVKCTAICDTSNN